MKLEFYKNGIRETKAYCLVGLSLKIFHLLDGCQSNPLAKSPCSFSADRSKVDPPLQTVFSSMVSYMAFVLVNVCFSSLLLFVRRESCTS